MEKYFKPFDVFIYLFLAAIIAVLFLLLIFPNKGEIEGIAIYSNRGLIYEHSFLNGESKILNDTVTEAINGNMLIVTINVGGEINILTIDIAKKSAKMTEASCPGRDCVSFSEITSPNNVIICATNGIKVIGKGNKGVTIPAG